MTRFVSCVIIVLGVWQCAFAAGQEPKSLQTFMRAKMKHSERILESLVQENYDGIAKGAQELSLLSRDAAWQVLKTPAYERQSQEFRRVADSLVEAAKKQDLDAAAVAYTQVTLSCVNCHKYLRKTAADSKSKKAK